MANIVKKSIKTFTIPIGACFSLSSCLLTNNNIDKVKYNDKTASITTSDIDTQSFNPYSTSIDENDYDIINWKGEPTYEEESGYTSSGSYDITSTHNFTRKAIRLEYTITPSGAFDINTLTLKVSQTGQKTSVYKVYDSDYPKKSGTTTKSLTQELSLSKNRYDLKSIDNKQEGKENYDKYFNSYNVSITSDNKIKIVCVITWQFLETISGEDVYNATITDVYDSSIVASLNVLETSEDETTIGSGDNEYSLPTNDFTLKNNTYVKDTNTKLNYYSEKASPKDKIEYGAYEYGSGSVSTTSGTVLRAVENLAERFECNFILPKDYDLSRLTLSCNKKGVNKTITTIGTTVYPTITDREFDVDLELTDIDLSKVDTHYGLNEDGTIESDEKYKSYLNKYNISVENDVMTIVAIVEYHYASTITVVSTSTGRGESEDYDLTLNVLLNGEEIEKYDTAPITEHNANVLIDKYKNGKQSVELEMILTKLYDNDNNLVYDYEKGQMPSIDDNFIVRGNLLNDYSNIIDKAFKICKVEFTYNGVPKLKIKGKEV